MIVWTLLGIAFLWDWNEDDLFQSCGNHWVFQISWHNEWSTLTASSFRIWNRSTGIPSPPLSLFKVMFPEAYLTSDSRMSGSRWVITPSWLSGSRRTFVYSSVYSCHLFLIYFASVMSISFLSFIVPIFSWNVCLVSLIFLKTSLVFPILLFSSISLHWSLRKPFLPLLALFGTLHSYWVYVSLSPLSFTSLLFSAICKDSSDKYFAFLHFFFLGMVFITASCTMLWTTVHRISGTLSIRSNPLNLFIISTL